MTRKIGNLKKLFLLIPILGSAVFVLLYFLATLYYPGGSQVDQQSVGFSWMNNYWCNLLNDTAINGQPNTAKPIAITGMLVLCLTLAYFWWRFASQMPLHKNWKLLIRGSGVASMLVAFFLFSHINHDLVINLASLFGMFAILGTFVGLYKKRWFLLFAFGIWNLLLVGLNNYLYYSKALIVYLPLVQKISFTSFLIWVVCIDFTIYHSRKNK